MSSLKRRILENGEKRITNALQHMLHMKNEHYYKFKIKIAKNTNELFEMANYCDMLFWAILMGI
uniref:Uncharacterized protein n=1 Tax=Onchocerca volvulus TaxID=6282 RepID=A0A8R1Y252_ONCVO